MQLTHLREYYEENPHLVTRRESERHPGLFTLKYKQKVFYDNLWVPSLQEMRGTVVDADWNCMIRPFKKIFNYNENEATIPLNEDVIATVKVNGFMGAITHVEGRGSVISTTGSLDSEFVQMAEDHFKPALREWISGDGKGWTWLFEIVDDRDPHIIQESLGPHLIGARNVETGQMKSEAELDYIQTDIWGEQCKVVTRRPEWQQTKFEHVLHWNRYALHEGYVVQGKTTTLKVKTPFYLHAKFLARVKADKLGHALENRQRIQDEEFFPLLDKIQAEQEAFTALNEQGRLTYIRDFFYG